MTLRIGPSIQVIYLMMDNLDARCLNSIWEVGLSAAGVNHTLTSVSRNNHNLSVAQSFSKAILFQVLPRPVDKSRNIFDTNNQSSPSSTTKNAMEDRDEISGTTTYIQDPRAGLESRQQFLNRVRVLWRRVITLT
jgi:hypothetical protein